MRAPTPPTSRESNSTNNKSPVGFSVETDPKASFPSTVHRMLTDIDEKESMKHLAKIISWQDHGMAFKIHDRQAFIDNIMPLWFSRLKYSSWVRQANLFGFKRIQMDSKDKGALWHENFIRGMPELAANITKVKKNKNRASMAMEIEKEPDFELMIFQRVGMPFNRVLSRTNLVLPAAGIQEEAKMTAEANSMTGTASASLSMSAHAPTLASATMTAHTMGQLPAPTLESSTSEGSLRDMLLPILSSSTNSLVDSTFPSFHHHHQNSEGAATGAVAQLETDNINIDPFESLWNNLGESIQSTPHNSERLATSSSVMPTAVPLMGNIWDMDMEPLRVFAPEHEHASVDHGRGQLSDDSNSELEQDAKRKPTKYARSA